MASLRLKLAVSLGDFNAHTDAEKLTHSLFRLTTIKWPTRSRSVRSMAYPLFWS